MPAKKGGAFKKMLAAKKLKAAKGKKKVVMAKAAKSK